MMRVGRERFEIINGPGELMQTVFQLIGRKLK